MSRPLASLVLLSTALIWGMAFVAQKSATLHMGPLTFTGIRYLIGGLVILPLALREKRRVGRPLTRTDRLMILVLSIAFFLGAWLQQLGLTMTTVTNGGFLTALYVLFTPLIGLAALRLRPHPIVWLCVPLALCGTFLLNGGRLDQFNAGDGLVILCAGFWAVQVLVLGIVSRATGMPVFVSAMNFLFVGAVAAILAPLVEAPSLAAIASGWVEIAYGALFGTALAFTLQAVGQQYVPPSNAAIILSAESLFAALGGALFLGERLPAIGYLGALLIFVAIVLVEAVPTLRAARDRRLADA